MGEFDYILAKHEDDGAMPLTEHLKNVAETAVVFARYAGFDTDTAYKGAILHDIGKVSPVFQKTLKHGYNQQPGFVFRHEIASLFFISLLPENQRPAIIDMIVAHHKSIYKDVRDKGLLDLDENMDSFARHSEKFEEWRTLGISRANVNGKYSNDCKNHHKKQLSHRIPPNLSRQLRIGKY